MTSLNTAPSSKHEFDQSDVLSSRLLADQPLPIHHLIPKKVPSLRCDTSAPHVWTGPLPNSQCFRWFGPHVYVATLEFCFLAVAKYLPMWRLIAFGYELCGGYYLLPDEWEFDRCTSPTNIGRLRAFVEQCKDAPGYTRAAEALRWVLDGSWSPRETILTMLLCLPPTLGGYGLPAPTLNRLVKLSPGASYIAGVDALTPDLCWPVFKLAIEYDSSRYHARNREQRLKTTLRAEALRFDGWLVISMTPDLLEDANAFSKIVASVAKRLQFPLPKDTKEAFDARTELRSHIVDLPLRYW